MRAISAMYGRSFQGTRIEGRRHEHRVLKVQSLQRDPAHVCGTNADKPISEANMLADCDNYWVPSLSK